MYVPAADHSLGDREWRPFVEGHAFGHLVAAGLGREVPVVVPTQFVLAGEKIMLHLAAPNPIFGAIDEQARVVMSVAGDWAYIPSDWKAVDGEDPTLGIPTTYYGAVQLEGTATVVTDPTLVAGILRAQLAVLQPGIAVADPELAHRARLGLIKGITIALDAVRAKFKYGGNVDDRHREAVIDRLVSRGGRDDLAAAAHVRRRGSGSTPPP